MERLPETIRLKEFKVTEKLPDYIAELPKNSKDLVTDIEKFYAQLATRVNWLLSHSVTNDE